MPTMEPLRFVHCWPSRVVDAPVAALLAASRACSARISPRVVRAGHKGAIRCAVVSFQDGQGHDFIEDAWQFCSGLGAFEVGWFIFGTIEWTSGANAGRRTEVLGHDVTDGIAVLTLLEAPVRAIAEGDAFTIRAGCDKRIETCGAKFANTASFRGFPHIPGQDAVLRYATKDGGHDGGVL